MARMEVENFILVKLVFENGGLLCWIEVLGYDLECFDSSVLKLSSNLKGSC